MYKLFFKRFLDFLMALSVLILVSPIFLVSLVLLSIANKGKAFFIQPRPGKNEKIFNIVKFKTMTDEKGPNGQLLSDKDRITKIGLFIRRTSLDELPQLINVLWGDMSMIGPRPLLVSYLPLYNGEQRKRHRVLPGITGWAQVNGRNAISWDQKFEYDVYYVDHQSFGLDMKILLKTIQKVFISEGISAADNATMPTFTGNS